VRSQHGARRADRRRVGEVEIDDQDPAGGGSDRIGLGEIEAPARSPDRERALQRQTLPVAVADEKDDGPNLRRERPILARGVEEP